MLEVVTSCRHPPFLNPAKHHILGRGGYDMDTTASRKELLEKMRSGLSCLDRFAAPGVSSELLNFRPDLEDAWTIQENLAHVLDSEMSLFLRIRQAIADPGSDALTGTPLDVWHQRFDHTRQPTKDTIAAFKAIHSVAYELLNRIEEQDWSTFVINHPTRGKQTLDDILRIIAGHVHSHVELIERNEKLWRERSS
jgi:hypothetical protein